MFYAFSCHGQHSFSLYSFADKYSITEIRRVVLRATARKEIHMQFILFSLGCFGAFDSVFRRETTSSARTKKAAGITSLCRVVVRFHETRVLILMQGEN